MYDTIQSFIDSKQWDNTMDNRIWSSIMQTFIHSYIDLQKPLDPGPIPGDTLAFYPKQTLFNWCSYNQ